MSITATVGTRDVLKGPYAGMGSPITAPYHIVRIPLTLSGTYATNGFQWDACSAFANARMGLSSIAVNWARVYGDYWDGALALTIQDSSIALASGGSVTPFSSGSTGNLITTKLFTGTNGTGGSEYTNGGAVAGSIVVLIACTLQQTLNGTSTFV